MVLQQVSTGVKSMIYERLGCDISMTIRRAEDGTKVEANSVYLLPSRKER